MSKRPMFLFLLAVALTWLAFAEPVDRDEVPRFPRERTEIISQLSGR